MDSHIVSNSEFNRMSSENIDSYHSVLEKDLNAPIDLSNTSKIEKLDYDQTHCELLPQEALNRPLEVGCESIRLTDRQKTELKAITGWSDNILDSIKSKLEAQVYVNANLKEVNGNLERADIDWNAKIPQDKIDRMRSLYGDDVADKWGNKTNRDLIKNGKAPYGPDGERVNLHHIGQRIDSPLAELTNIEHKQNDGILHDKTKLSEIERPVFRTERKQYWQARYKSIWN